MDMEAQVTIKNLPQLVKEGKVSMQAVDDAVSRILKLKFKLGLFDNPYRFSDEARKNPLFSPRLTGRRRWMLPKNRSYC